MLNGMRLKTAAWSLPHFGGIKVRLLLEGKKESRAGLFMDARVEGRMVCR